MKKPELLAPAGNLERLKIAVEYGADAVYIGGRKFGLRAFADNFTIEEIQQGVEYCHTRNKKLYLTLNIFARNNDINDMSDYVEAVSATGIDAFIISDPGIISIVKEIAPSIDIHLSTQANTTNYKSAMFWYSQGVKRIILARELSLEEIREINEKTPDDLELEAFVHGAMCISYSGRCLLSSYLANRDSNRGQCAHPCRWEYNLIEKSRPNQEMPILQDERGTYIFNSKDLCMIEHLDKLHKAGIVSLKIEGRMKTSYYVATIINAYRRQLDSYINGDNKSQSSINKLQDELEKASHRPFTTGFYFGNPGEKGQEYPSSKYIRTYDFIGIVQGYDEERQLIKVEQRNHFKVGDEVEFLIPGNDYQKYKLEKILDKDFKQIEVAPHPQQIVYLPSKQRVKKFSILRRNRGKKEA